MSVDPNTCLSPMPPAPSFPASPSSGTRKRSIHEVDDATPSPNAKRTTDHAGEDQENRAPSLPLPADHGSPASDAPKTTMTPRSTIEIVVRNAARNLEDRSNLDRELTSPSNKASNPEPDTPASKKRKVASAGKDAKQQEKEAKDRQKAEEKSKKEEEKVKREEEKVKKEEEKRLRAEEKKKREAEREEEKRKKEAQREEERKQRDEKKKAKEDEKAAKEAAKEEEKRKKDEEKEKKTRSQMKLNSFFAKPTLPPTSSSQVTTVPSSPRKSSTGEASHEPRELQSDYVREFPAFFLKSHTIVAPPHRFERDVEALAHVRQTVDSSLSKETLDEIHPFRPSEVFQLIPFNRRRGQRTASVREILSQLQKSDEQPAHSQDTAKPQQLLRKVTMKSLKFGEDIRPPYQGTYTRHVPESSAKRLARNPYHRGLPDTNYDYDSEAEWEEPEEGEELDSEEEDEGSDEGEDDLDGFLDDEDDALAEGKRRLIVGDLEPVTTGIQWAADGVPPENQLYRIQTISDGVNFPIDPFSTAYWEKPKPLDQPAKAPSDGFRVPALPVPAAGGVLPPSKAKRPFPPEQIAEFKEAVEGSDLSKIGLVEILKKRFPKVSKETLKATLDQVAVRVGQKEVDKKWVCR